MLSASDIPVPETDHDRQSSPSLTPTSVLLLPAFTIIENVTPNSVVDLIQDYISTSPTNTTPLSLPAVPNPPRLAYPIPTSTPPPDLSRQDGCPPSLLVSRPCPHKYLILLCSQRSRDARCGQSAPLLRREFERHLRPLGLYRDLYDERPGGVGIYFISHVGGHKFAANVMIYRRQAADNNTKAKREGTSEDEQIARKIKDLAIAGKSDVIKDMGEAGQCIWLARVRPEDCEGIIKFTVLQGKVVKPERQLRGGFDREKGLVSW